MDELKSISLKTLFPVNSLMTYTIKVYNNTHLVRLYTKHACIPKIRLLTANPQHVDGGLVKLDEHAVVDLPKPEKLEGLLDLRSDLVNTTNPHNESELVLRRHVVTTLLLGFTNKTNILAFHLLVKYNYY